MHHSILCVCNQPDQILIGVYSKWEGDKFVFQGIRAQGTFQIIGWTVLEAESEDHKHMKCIQLSWLGSRRKHDAGDRDPWQLLGIKGRRQSDCKALRLTPCSVSLTETRCQMVRRLCWSGVIYLFLSSIKIRSFWTIEKSMSTTRLPLKWSQFWKEKHLHIYWKQGLLKEKNVNDLKILTSTLRLLESGNRISWYLVYFSKNNKRSIRTPEKKLPSVFAFHMILD